MKKFFFFLMDTFFPHQMPPACQISSNTNTQVGNAPTCAKLSLVICLFFFFNFFFGGGGSKWECVSLRRIK